MYILTGTFRCNGWWLAWLCSQLRRHELSTPWRQGASPVCSTRCNTLQNTAIHCSTQQPDFYRNYEDMKHHSISRCITCVCICASHCNTVTCCNESQHAATRIATWTLSQGASRGWKQPRMVQFFGTKYRCWSAKWPNSRSNCTQIQIGCLFWGW